MVSLVFLIAGLVPVYVFLYLATCAFWTQDSLREAHVRFSNFSDLKEIFYLNFKFGNQLDQMFLFYFIYLKICHFVI